MSPSCLVSSRRMCGAADVSHQPNPALLRRCGGACRPARSRWSSTMPKMNVVGSRPPRPSQAPAAAMSLSKVPIVGSRSRSRARGPSAQAHSRPRACPRGRTVLRHAVSGCGWRGTQEDLCTNGNNAPPLARHPDWPLIRGHFPASIARISAANGSNPGGTGDAWVVERLERSVHCAGRVSAANSRREVPADPRPIDIRRREG